MAECAQTAETNKWGRHLISPTGVRAVDGRPSRTNFISSTASTDKILQDSQSIEENYYIEAKKLHTEKKMIDLQLNLSRQFEMCTDLEEQLKVNKNYETKMDH